MEINKILIRIITIISFVIVIFFDIINISKYIDYTSNIDSTISNTIGYFNLKYTLYKDILGTFPLYTI